MEGRVHHPFGTIRTNGDVLWTLQLTPNLPSVHEPQLFQLHMRTMVGNLHGRPCDLSTFNS